MSTSLPAKAKAKKSVGRRVLRAAGWTFLAVSVALVSFALWIIFFFPNDLVRGVTQDAAKSFGISLSIGSLDVHPLSGVVVEEVTVDVPANRALPPLASVKRVEVGWKLRDVFKRTVHVTKIEVEHPRLHVRQDGTKWNVERVLDTLMAAPVETATPAPTPVATSRPFEEELETQSEQIEELLAQIPVSILVDRLSIRDAGIEIATDDGTIARVEGAGVDFSLSLPRGGAGTVTVEAIPKPGITIAVQPSGDVGFSGRLEPAASVKMEIPRKVEFDTKTTLADALVIANDLEMPLAIDVAAGGDVDIPRGDVKVTVSTFDVGGFFTAQGSLDVKKLGTEGIHAEWSTGIHGDKLPSAITDEVKKSMQANRLASGGTIKGRIDGTLDSSDPAKLLAAFEKGRFPLTLVVVNEGQSDPDLLDSGLVKIGQVSHHAKLEIGHEKLAAESKLSVTGIRNGEVFAGTPFSVNVDGAIEVPPNLDGLDVTKARVAIPERGLEVYGQVTLRGLKNAYAAFNADADPMKAGLGALTALEKIDAQGGLVFRSPKEVEIAGGAYMGGSVTAAGRVTRGKDPFGKVKAEVFYDGFSARVADTSPWPKPSPGASPTPKPTPKPDLLALSGMDAHLTMEREIVLGGRQKTQTVDVAEDERVVFDPATRGYYDRLGSLRAESDNVRIAKVVAGPLRMEDLSAEVIYDGTALKVNRGRMQLLGGEVVGRMIVRPTSKGLRFTMAGDMSGIDMSPLLLEKAVANPNDTRIHMSSQASFFLSSDDPIGSLADAKARIDVTAAGSKVLDTMLAWLDPENKDPMYNWARSVNSKVMGITRPQVAMVADRGMYDVTITFPSLDVSKDVKRIPLRPLLDLRFTQEMIGAYAPPGEMLPLLAARGIDQDGTLLLPPVPIEED